MRRLSIPQISISLTSVPETPVLHTSMSAPLIPQASLPKSEMSQLLIT